jgi:hypothetical protein
MENTQITTQENATTAVANLDITNFAELVERSTQLEKAKAILTLTAEYIELEKPGESFRGVYIGEQTMEIADKATGEIKALIAARFLVNKQVKINAGVVLVNEIKRAGINVGTPIEITYVKKEGNTKLYSITLIG